MASCGPPTLPAIAPLPVDAVLPELVAALAAVPAAVLAAPPGAGKTSRVPLALLDAPWRADGAVVMLEPRRVAARAAARRLAATLGEPLGRTVGLTTRGLAKTSRATRVEVVTEGVLTNRLLRDPSLEGGPAPTRVVVFDEFHERSLQADLGLALALQARDLFRAGAPGAPDLRIVVMSATLDVARVAALLTRATGAEAAVVESAGRAFPVETRLVGTPPVPSRGGWQARPGVGAGVVEGVAAAVRRALAEEDGSVLAFLPGAGEIRRAADLLAGLPPGVRLAPLYGDLSAAEQDAAVAPAPAGTRKVVLATSIAETSLTIDGVRVVVDGGLARRPRFDAGSGMTRLETVRLSRAEAAQRAGRAGRTAPGVAYRLWGPSEDAALQPFAPPEIAAADLAPLALALAAWGAAPGDLAWLDPPPAAAFEAATGLLRELHALGADGALTEHGRALAELPAHPRLAHLAAAAPPHRRALAADVVALLSERDLFRWDGRLPDADLRLRVEALRGADGLAHRGARLDRGALSAARAESERWRRRLGAGGGDAGDLHDAGRLLALAYPDRVAQRTGEGKEGARYRMREGRTALLDASQPLADAPFLAIGALDDRPGGARVFTAAPLSAEEIEALFADDIVAERVVRTDGGAVRVAEVRRLGAVVLAEAPAQATPAERQTALLDAVRHAGLDALPWSTDAARLRERLACLHHHAAAGALPGAWPDVSDDALLATIDVWLAPHLGAARRLADLGRLDLGGLLLGLVPWALQRELDRLAPSHVTVPSGSVRPLDYADPAAPALAVRLQEVFGLTETPRVLGGRLPLVMHLLSPAGRPAQVTTDLASFWAEGYFDVRRDLRGRYPKHAWPDDPLAAEPTARAKRRR